MSRKSCGALWQKKATSGYTYFSGKLEKKDLLEIMNSAPGDQVPIVVFTNQYKDKENKPDFLIYISDANVNKSPQNVNKKQQFIDLEDDLPF